MRIGWHPRLVLAFMAFRTLGKGVHADNAKFSAEDAHKGYSTKSVAKRLIVPVSAMKMSATLSPLVSPST